jgi:hypothetical protein
MSRFDEAGTRSFRARDAVLVVVLAALLLALFEGPSILRAGEQMTGLGGRIVRSIGRPANRVSLDLSLNSAARSATAFLAPQSSLATAGGGFAGAGTPPPPSGPRAPHAGARPHLHTLLVTGDSMSEPLDSYLAQGLLSDGVHVIQDPHIGTAISNSLLVDWGKLARQQATGDRPDAVVIFIGANEGWPMPGPDGRKVQCCATAWATIFAQRVRVIADDYRQVGARVYWVTLPLPREPARQTISRVVNSAVEHALEPLSAQVTVFDSVPIFTPHGYRDAMQINGTQTIVRQPDGIHLNDAGSSLLAGDLIRDLRRDWRL